MVMDLLIPIGIKDRKIVLYTGFISASRTHIEWLKDEIKANFGLDGVIRFNVRAYRLMYAKRSSIILLKKIYYREGLPCLERKRFKIEQALGIISKQADVLKLVYRLD